MNKLAYEFFTNPQDLVDFINNSNNIEIVSIVSASQHTYTLFYKIKVK